MLVLVLGGGLQAAAEVELHLVGPEVTVAAVERTRARRRRLRSSTVSLQPRTVGPALVLFLVA